MENFKQYETNIKEHPNFVLLVRNALMSKVTGSSLHHQEVIAIQKALKVYKSKKRIKIMEKFMVISIDVKVFSDIIPAVNTFIDYINSISK